jgi:hypothetical protein
MLALSKDSGTKKREKTRNKQPVMTLSLQHAVSQYTTVDVAVFQFKKGSIASSKKTFENCSDENS